MIARLRDLAHGLMLGVASMLALLLVGELGLRLVGYQPSADRPKASVSTPGRGVLLDCYPTNPSGYFHVDLRDADTYQRYQRLGVRRLDRVAARAPWAVEFRYNSAGFRGPEPPPRRPGVLRVAVLGDSFSEGQGVDESDALPAVLQRALERGRPGAFEVLNCGRRAADFPELRALFKEVLALQPDLVVYAMVPNDTERSPELERRWSDLVDLVEDRRQGLLAREFRRLDLLDSRLLTLIRGRLETLRIHRESLRLYNTMYGPGNPGWPHTCAQLREMREAMERRGGGFLIALWPLLAGLEGSDPLAPVGQAVSACCAEAGIQAVALRPALAGRPDASLWVHPQDQHPNALAYRLVAERLAPEVLRLATRLSPASGR